MDNLRSMLSAKAVALIGATEKEAVIGRTILENLLRSKEVKVYPVNPDRQKVLGVDAYPDIAGIPDHVDLAIVATPAHTVPGVVEECGKAGVNGVVIISAGFKEIGEEGKKAGRRDRRHEKKVRDARPRTQLFGFPEARHRLECDVSQK